MSQLLSYLVDGDILFKYCDQTTNHMLSHVLVYSVNSYSRYFHIMLSAHGVRIYNSSSLANINYFVDALGDYLTFEHQMFSNCEG